MLIENVNTMGYAQYRIPGIVITKSGSLVAYYECRKIKSDWADIDIKVIRSTDGGKSWQTVKVIYGNENTLNNPVMFVKDEEIHFLFLKNYYQLFHCVSTDDGVTFSEPEEKEVECNFFYNVMAVGPGHGIVHNGKMIVPVWFGQNRENHKAHRPSIIATLYSTDGEDWKIGEFIGGDELINPSECTLAVTNSGEVLISIRNENPCRQRALALSDDGIGGWHDLSFSCQLPDPVCMGSMCYENGKVYHINCDSQSARENLTVKISSDTFNSFEKIFIDSPAGYADMAIKDGEIFIMYERDYNNDGMYFTKIRT